MSEELNVDEINEKLQKELAEHGDELPREIRELLGQLDEWIRTPLDREGVHVLTVLEGWTRGNSFETYGPYASHDEITEVGRRLAPRNPNLTFVVSNLEDPSKLSKG